jgi:hypothetical protein
MLWPTRLLKVSLSLGPARLRFFAEKLNYTPDRDSSLAHLKTTYHKYLADLFAVKTEEIETAKVADQ